MHARRLPRISESSFDRKYYSNRNSNYSQRYGSGDYQSDARQKISSRSNSSTGKYSRSHSGSSRDSYRSSSKSSDYEQRNFRSSCRESSFSPPPSKYSRRHGDHDGHICPTSYISEDSRRHFRSSTQNGVDHTRLADSRQKIDASPQSSPLSRHFDSRRSSKSHAGDHSSSSSRMIEKRRKLHNGRVNVDNSNSSISSPSSSSSGTPSPRTHHNGTECDGSRHLSSSDNLTSHRRNSNVSNDALSDIEDGVEDELDACSRREECRVSPYRSRNRTQPHTNWSEQRSSSGRIYYYNCVSEVSQWVKPQELIDYELAIQRLNDQLCRDASSALGRRRHEDRTMNATDAIKKVDVRESESEDNMELSSPQEQTSPHASYSMPHEGLDCSSVSRTASKVLSDRPPNMSPSASSASSGVSSKSVTSTGEKSDASERQVVTREVVTMGLAERRHAVDQARVLSSTLAKYNRDDLTGHVRIWADTTAVDRLECQQHRDNLSIARLSSQLKMARSLVRLAEIQATLQEQRIFFLRQQMSDLEESASVREQAIQPVAAKLFPFPPQSQPETEVTENSLEVTTCREDGATVFVSSIGSVSAEVATLSKASE